MIRVMGESVPGSLRLEDWVRKCTDKSIGIQPRYRVPKPRGHRENLAGAGWYPAYGRGRDRMLAASENV